MKQLHSWIVAKFFLQPSEQTIINLNDHNLIVCRKACSCDDPRACTNINADMRRNWIGHLNDTLRYRRMPKKVLSAKNRYTHSHASMIHMKVPEIQEHNETHRKDSSRITAALNEAAPEDCVQVNRKRVVRLMRTADIAGYR